MYGDAEAANEYAEKGVGRRIPLLVCWDCKADNCSQPPLPQDTASFTWADLLHFWDRSAAQREMVRRGSC